MYTVRFNYPGVPYVAYKVFKTLEEATEFSKTVDLIEILNGGYQ